MRKAKKEKRPLADVMAENDDEIFFHEYLEGGIVRKRLDKDKDLAGQYNPRKALFVRRLPTCGTFLAKKDVFRRT